MKLVPTSGMCFFDEGSTYLATAEMSRSQTILMNGLHVDNVVECSVMFLRQLLSEFERDTQFIVKTED